MKGEENFKYSGRDKSVNLKIFMFAPCSMLSHPGELRIGSGDDTSSRTGSRTGRRFLNSRVVELTIWPEIFLMFIRCYRTCVITGSVIERHPCLQVREDNGKGLTVNLLSCFQLGTELGFT